MSESVSTRSWLIKIVGMLLALAAVIWVMRSLQSPSAVVSDPNNPVGALLGVEPKEATTTSPTIEENVEDKVIRARVKKDL